MDKHGVFHQCESMYGSEVADVGFFQRNVSHSIGTPGQEAPSPAKYTCCHTQIVKLKNILIATMHNHLIIHFHQPSP